LNQVLRRHNDVWSTFTEGSALIDGVSLESCELLRGEHVQAAMRSEGVVLDDPVCDRNLGFCERVELLGRLNLEVSMIIVVPMGWSTRNPRTRT
jgi:hypothetical protein